MAKPKPVKRLPASTRSLPPKAIKVGRRHRKDFGDVEGLAASIEARGLLHPVVVTPAAQLIAGERRLLAWKKAHNGKPIPVRVLDVDSIVAVEWDENAQRKDFTPSEAVDIKRALEPIEAAAARARQLAGKPAAGGGRAGDKASKVTGRDRKTIAKAEAIVDAAKADPKRYGKLLDDMDRTGRVDGPFKRLTVLQQAAEIRKETPPLPNRGPYRVMVIDFPWAAEPGAEAPAERGRGYYKYPTMSTAEICAMSRDKIAPLLHRDAWLWLWIPNFHCARGENVPVLQALGVEASTLATWRKNKIGQGQVLRGQSEQVIVARRGRPTISLTNETTIFDGRVRGHSEKPENFYTMVEKLCPAPRYAELFARRKLPANWDGHGDQVGTLGGAP